jgi:hypothetical protein
MKCNNFLCWGYNLKGCLWRNQRDFVKRCPPRKAFNRLERAYGKGAYWGYMNKHKTYLNKQWEKEKAKAV